MGAALTAAFGAFLVSADLCQEFAWAQHVQLPGGPSDKTVIPPDVLYPDAVTCDVTSPAGITYRTIFYKSQTVSFGTEPNNVAEYGTTFIRDPDKFDVAVPYKWWLQLGRPGNITAIIIPSGWRNENCPVGKTITDLARSKQVLKLFTTQ
jgi:hypothetical protein